MVTLNTRCRDILMLLLQSQSHLTSVEIAARLDITPSMVRYTLHDIETWLQGKDICLIRKPGYGTFVDAPAGVKTELVEELERLNDYALLLSPWERMYVLIFSLLMSEQPLIVKQLEPRLGVSRPTVLKDMDQAEAWLQKHNISLVRRPGFGFRVVAEERHWRETVVGFLLDTVGEMPLLALCGGSTAAFKLQMRGKAGLLHILRAFLDGLELTYCSRLVDSVESRLSLEFADNSYVSVVLHLAILIDRVGQGKIVGLPPGLVERLRDLREFEVAQTAVEQIAERFRILPARSEVAHISMQLLGAKSRRSISDITGESEADRLRSEVLELVDALLVRASMYLHPCLRVDQQLIRSLAFHLEPVLCRLRFNLPIRNPLLEDIRRRYPYVVKVAQRSSEVLEAKLGVGIPEEEVGYIAMHLGAAMERLRPSSGVKRRVLVVCGEGVATAWFLVSRIQSELPEIEVMEVMSASEVCRRHTFRGDVDAMISTIPMRIAGLPIVVVSPLLDARDKARIRKVLNIGAHISKAIGSTDEVEGPPLASLITAETIGLRVAARDWQEVVDEAGSLLLAVGAIEPRYIEAMKEIIARYGPYAVIRPGVVLLHARPQDGVRRLCMSLVTTQRAVEFGHRHNDPVGLAIAFGAVGNHSHLKALAQLAELLGDQARVDGIREAAAKSEVLEIVSTLPPRSSSPLLGKGRAV